MRYEIWFDDDLLYATAHRTIADSIFRNLVRSGYRRLCLLDTVSGKTLDTYTEPPSVLANDPLFGGEGKA